MLSIFKRLYIWSTGYSYTNLGRLFLRLFVGLMLMQFGVRQMYNFHELVGMYPSMLGMSPGFTMTIMIIIETLCSLCIMLGFCTRIMTIPPFIAMCMAEYHVLVHVVTVPSYMLTWAMPGYLPIMFLGIYFFIMLVGPGKISIDYFLSLYLLHSDNKSESELEEV